jgi:predicted dinucleotide-binding enzyme
VLGAGRVGTTLAWLVAAVAAVIESIGYDVVAMASLRAGRALQPGGPVFGASLRRDEFALAVRENAAA